MHFATELPDGTWVVELRPPGGGTDGPVRDAVAGERIAFPGAGWLQLRAGYPDPAARRQPAVDGRRRGAGGRAGHCCARHGRPISYGYIARRWPLDAYQTVFARHPGQRRDAERRAPVHTELVTELVSRGVVRGTDHPARRGVSSLEDGELPPPEPFAVPRADGAAGQPHPPARAGGWWRSGRPRPAPWRAWQSRTARCRPGEGWTELVLGPDRPARAVDGLITGWHDPGASHLLLLEAVAGAELVGRAYRAAVRQRLPLARVRRQLPAVAGPTPGCPRGCADVVSPG